MWHIGTTAASGHLRRGAGYAGKTVSAPETPHESAQSALLEDISLALSNYVDNQGLAFPLESNLLIARK